MYNYIYLSIYMHESLYIGIIFVIAKASPSLLLLFCHYHYNHHYIYGFQYTKYFSLLFILPLILILN